jgi:uncharacterized protein involved in type VI secretion and phage assembly
MQSPFENPSPGYFQGCYLAEVLEVEPGKVLVELLSMDDGQREDDNDKAEAIWARVAVPFAGNKRGAFLMPDVKDEVVVTFINGDPRAAIVIGTLWNGQHEIPESIDGTVDRWSLVGKKGTRIAIVEESEPAIQLSTPGGVKITMSDESGGKIEMTAGPTTVTLDQQGMSISTSTFSTTASEAKCVAGKYDVKTPQAKFSMMVDCIVLKAVAVNSELQRPAIGSLL